MSQDTLREALAELRGALEDLARRVARREHAESVGDMKAIT